MNAQIQPKLLAAVLPGTIKTLGRRVDPGKEVWTLDAGALAYTNRALLSYCDYTPEFGGTVEHTPDGVVVTVYTD